VPIPIGPTAAASRSDCSNSTTTAPIIAEVAAADAGGFPTRVNQMIAETANAFAFGGTTYGIAEGLELTDGGGLALNVDPGSGACFGSIQYPGGTKALADNATNYVWLLQGSTIAAPTIVTPPSTDCVYLGAVTTLAGVITAIDTSGVCYVSGGLAVRQTADLGMPGDTPAANTRFVTRTLYGDWLWDGSGYALLPQGPTRVAINLAADENLTLSQTQYSARRIEITDTGPVLTTGQDIVFPAVASEFISLKNGTAQTLTAKVSGQTGVAIAAGKTQLLVVDGTDVRKAYDI
jgi:hypothetical protein